jgi:hypothetical protein
MCLSQLILLEEKSLQHVVSNCREHYERNHPGKHNLSLFPSLWGMQVRVARSVVNSGSAAYSNTLGVPHGYFYPTGSAWIT